MVILLNNYIFIKPCDICMILSALKANKLHFKTRFLQRKRGRFRYVALVHDDVGDFQNYMTHMCTWLTLQRGVP